MYRYLYKFTCAPNYGVVSDATLIFQSPLHPNHFIEAMLEAKTLARAKGFKYVEERPKLEFLGRIELSKEFRSSQTIIAISGEY